MYIFAIANIHVNNIIIICDVDLVLVNDFAGDVTCFEDILSVDALSSHININNTHRVHV